MVARSFSSFRKISSTNFLYSLLEDVSYSVGSILPYQNSSRILIQQPPHKPVPGGRFPLPVLSSNSCEPPMQAAVLPCLVLDSLPTNPPSTTPFASDRSAVLPTCGNRFSVKIISLNSIGLFCSKNALRILPYLPRGCVPVCANLMSGI